MDDQEPEFKPLVIIETLVEHGVKFVVVGGQAAAFHGAARLTADADLVVDQHEDNLRRLSAALDELDWRFRVDGLADSEARLLRSGQPMHPDNLLARTTTLMTDAGAVDILSAIPTLNGEAPLRDYEALNRQATDYQVFPGLKVRVAALDHIIESKRFADRPKDHAALPELIDLAQRAVVSEQTSGPGDPLRDSIG